MTETGVPAGFYRRAQRAQRGSSTNVRIHVSEPALRLCVEKCLFCLDDSGTGSPKDSEFNARTQRRGATEHGMRGGAPGQGTGPTIGASWGGGGHGLCWDRSLCPLRAPVNLPCGYFRISDHDPIQTEIASTHARHAPSVPSVTSCEQDHGGGSINLTKRDYPGSPSRGEQAVVHCGRSSARKQRCPVIPQPQPLRRRRRGRRGRGRRGGRGPWG